MIFPFGRTSKRRWALDPFDPWESVAMYFSLYLLPRGATGQHNLRRFQNLKLETNGYSFKFGSQKASKMSMLAPPRQGPSEMLFDLNNKSIVVDTIAAYILFSIYGHGSHGVKGTSVLLLREYHGLDHEHTWIKTCCLQRALFFFKNVYCFTISHEKFYSHVSMIRIVANSFEMRLNIDYIQGNAICINTIFVPKNSINRNFL